MEREELKTALVKAVLPEVPFEGWGPKALALAAQTLGLNREDVARAFPNGARDAVEHWSALADQELLDGLAALDLSTLKLRQRIATAVKMRLAAAGPHREAVRRAMSVLALPTNQPLAWRLLYRTVDTIWYGVGDRSTDFSFYTKRATLAAVYSATLLYWLDDASEGFTDSWGFLDRRIEDLMRLPKLMGSLRGHLFGAPLRAPRRRGA